jgi:signal transduction histidine kinase
MQRPAPDQYQPRLGTWNHLWRVAVMVVVSVATFGSAVQGEADVSGLWVAGDVVVGLVAYVVVFYRRRWPFPVAVGLALVSAVSGMSAGPGVLAAVSLATRRRVWEIAVVGSVATVCGALFTKLTSDDAGWVDLAVNAIFAAGALGWGMYIGSRRELIWTLRHRAESAEAEQALRVAQARDLERHAIAREMHDVLAHRISQISMHAGALAFREDLTADQMRAGISSIRDKAHEALTDLRAVLGVLRETDHGRLTPQPTYADLATLVEDARGSGLAVHLTDDVHDGPPPPAVGRTAYRIVQEGITNVRKHAPGARLAIGLAGAPGDGLTIELSNPLGFGRPDTPGAGLGLIGLTERAQLSGGRLEHHREDGRFVLRAWIPWAT